MEVDIIYPPEIESFRPAFLVTERNPRIYFSFSKYNVESIDGMCVHYVLADQTTNESVLSNNSKIVAAKIQRDQDRNGACYIELNLGYLKGNPSVWQNNKYYKLQLRFDTLNGITFGSAETGTQQTETGGSETGAQQTGEGGTYTETDNAAYMNDYDNQLEFSEWSKVCLLRPISQPNVRLTRFVDSGSDAPAFAKGIIPVVGRLVFSDPKETDRLQYYKITVLDSEKEDVLLETEQIYTGDLQNPNEINHYIDIQGIDTSESSTFVLRVDYITANRYRNQKDFEFAINPYVSNPNFDPEITVDIDNDNGFIDLHIVNSAQVFGTLWVKRSDASSDFKVWETLKIYIVGFEGSDSPGSIDIRLRDRTAKSLQWYMYSVQLENQHGNFTALYRSDKVLTDFYDMYLLRQDVCAPVKYNYKVSSFKPVVNRVKFDTLGGRYPKFAENANMDYKQFSITGLISAQADEEAVFLERSSYFADDYDSYRKYKTRYPLLSFSNRVTEGDGCVRNRLDSIVPTKVAGKPDKYDRVCYFDGLMEDTDGEKVWPVYISSEEDYDFFWEREYREELVRWLNDGEPKLYRSMTEGNMAVMLTDISLTPNAALGRRIWDFSATVYQVGEGESIAELYDLGIWDIYTPLSYKLLGSTDDTDRGHYDRDALDGDDVPDIDIKDPYITVEKPGQIYTLDLTSGNDVVSTVISPDFRYRYGGSLSVRDPSDYVMSSVRVYFHNLPHRFNSDLNIVTDIGTDTATSYLGYKLQINGSTENIFVPYRPNDEIPGADAPVNGYYVVPDNIKVSSLTFPNGENGDVVTVEYAITYKERSQDETEKVKSMSLVKRTVGQFGYVLEPGVDIYQQVARRYTLISKTDKGVEEYVEEMQHWLGISIQADPYSVFEVKYTGANKWTQLVVGRTGVLHFMEDTHIDGFRAVGMRLFEGTADSSEWEYQVDADDSQTEQQERHVRGDKILYNGQLRDFVAESKGIILVKAPVNGSLDYKADIMRIRR